MMKICPRCNTKYAYRESCPNNCYDKVKTERNKVYDKYQRKNADFYGSKEWVRLTGLCREKFNGLDVYQLYKYGKYAYGELTHHIEEVKDNKDRALDLGNLIYVSDSSHREIHAAYNKSNENKLEMQEYLLKCIENYKKQQ